MKHVFRLMAVATAVAVMGCSSDSSGPSGKTTAKATDPTGDTYGVGATQWDLTALTVTRDSGGVDVALDFTANVTSELSGSANYVIGYVDLDTDQDSTTGGSSIVDAFRPGAGSTGMGVDYQVELFNFYADSTVSVYDNLGNEVGTLRPTFSGKRISFRVPRALLGADDGYANVAAVVGTGAEPTDIGPNTGHLKVGGTGPVAPHQTAAPSGRRSTPQRVWGQ